MKDIETLVTLAKCFLVRKFPFFSTILMHTDIVADESKGTAATDYKKFYYAPSFIKEVTKTLNESNKHLMVSGILVHEVLHVALNHLSRKGGRENQLWNVACDLAINQIVVSSTDGKNSLMLPPGALFDKRFDGMAAEQIYSILQKEVENKDCNIGTVGNGSIGVEGVGFGKDGIGNHDDWKKVPKEEIPTLEKQWKQVVARAATVARQAGKMPGNLAGIVDDLLDPKLPWKTMLAHFIKPSCNDYDFCPPDRRFMNKEYGYIGIPVLQGETIDDLVIAIDTSASVSNDELSKFLAEMKCIVSLYPQMSVKVITCDWDIQEVVDIGSYNISDVKFKGRGGTRFTPPFDYIQKENINPVGLIYLTDGYGEFPQPAQFPVLWIYVGGNKQAPPFGTLTYLD